MKKYLFLFLLLVSCRTERPLDPTPAIKSKHSLLAGDTLVMVVPDSLPTPKTSLKATLNGVFGKFKNRGTIIIQQGAGNVAAPITKSKSPVAVAAKEAEATVIDKPKNSAITTGDASPATTVPAPTSLPWWVWLVGVLALLYGGYRLKNKIM